MRIDTKKLPKDVQRVLSEVWPIALNAHGSAGYSIVFTNWRTAFESEEYIQQQAWIAIAEWHLGKMKKANTP
jgi:hypothetical protein